MDITGERYHPDMYDRTLLPADPNISYEHWHRYQLAATFVAGKTVLDIAFGEGYGSHHLAKFARQVVGVDVSAEAVAHASANYAADNLTFRHGAADDIPVPGRHVFDVIVSFETLEHLDAATQQRFAAEAKRLLTPGGLLIISTPNQRVYSGANSHANPFHLCELTEGQFRDYLEASFRHVQIFNQHVYPGSYIWSEGSADRCNDYCLELVGRRYQPVPPDRKESRYFIAFCSDAAFEPANRSVLLDVSADAFCALRVPGQLYETCVYLNRGDGFDAANRVTTIIDYAPEHFVIDLELPRGAPVCGLRWDPLELRLCRVRLDSVVWHDAAGNRSDLDLNTVLANGVLRPDGAIDFDTLDPMIFFPITGDVARVSIRGHCEIDDAYITLLRLNDFLADREKYARNQTRCLDSRTGLETSLYLDSGAGFRGEEVYRQRLEERGGSFRLTFPLNPAARAARLRWDPVELRLCRVRLDEVSWRDAAGNVFAADLSAVESNGVRQPDGNFAFDTLDPMIYLPVAGDLAEVTLAGRLEIDDLFASLARVHRLLDENEQRARALANSVETLTRESRHFRSLQTFLYCDTGSNFRAEEMCGQQFDERSGPFHLVFTPRARVNRLRWDPVELRLCRVWLEAVSWRDSAGATYALDLSAVESNGVRQPDGSFAFDTLDPMIYLPVAGDVAEVALVGRLEIDDAIASLSRLNGILQHNLHLSHQREQLLRELEERLRDRDEKLRNALSRLDEREQQLRTLEQHRDALDRQLHAILGSKRWRVINSVRSACKFVPRLLRSVRPRRVEDPTA
jgi:SAM-dependent methyltransferase